MEIEAKLLGLTVKELHRVCEICKMAEDIKSKTRRALVKHITKFCEREDLLEREDEGMSVLLELNDTLAALRRRGSTAVRPGTCGCGGERGRGGSGGSARVGRTAGRPHTRWRHTSLRRQRGRR